ncbi:MAG: hypothetical protein J6W96_06185 [Alphaproteobacteria bacterium]|nr:hypothetical protein [Alphaproteobacteria bacterium]
MSIKKFLFVLWLIGAALLAAGYLFAVENCRPACVVFWILAPFYFIAGAAIMEG